MAIVNQRFVEKFWRGEEPVGKRLRIFNDGKPEPWLTVVGVAPNVLQNGVAVKEFDPLVYVPYRQRTMPDMALMARTRVPPRRCPRLSDRRRRPWMKTCRSTTCARWRSGSR